MLFSVWWKPSIKPWLEGRKAVCGVGIYDDGIGRYERRKEVEEEEKEERTGGEEEGEKVNEGQEYNPISHDQKGK